MYTLQIYLEIIEGHKINISEEVERLEIENLIIKIKDTGNNLLLMVDGITSEDHAKNIFNQLRTAIHLLSIKLNIGIKFENTFRVLDKFPDPKKAAQNIAKSFGVQDEEDKEVDYIIDEHENSLFLTESKKMHLKMGNASLTIGVPVKSILYELKEGINLHINADSLDSKLKIAVNIYNSHFFENTLKSKYITLVMALECLSPRSKKHKIASKIFKTVTWALFKFKLLYKINGEKEMAIQSLIDDLKYKEELSITNQLKIMVKTALEKNRVNSSEIDQKLKFVSKVYDLRSRLVHDGIINKKKPLDLKEIENTIIPLRELVALVLKSKIIS